MKIIILRGKMNAGKTTTCGLVYSELVKIANKEHLFNRETVFEDSLRLTKEGKSVIDFAAVLTIGKLKIGIISEGDIAEKLNCAVEIMKLLKVDVIICCTRSVNSKGSSYRMILDNYAKEHEIVKEVWVKRSDKLKDKFLVKEKAVNEVVKQIKSLTNQ